MKYCALFSGQGSQYVGMGKELCDNYEEAKKIYVSVDKLLGFSLSKQVFSDNSQILEKTKWAQLAILTYSIAIWEVLVRRIEFSSFVSLAGHSVGEYAALYAAGVISLEDVIRLVEKRGGFMEESSSKKKGGMMAIVGNDISYADIWIEEHGMNEIFKSNVNGYNQVTYSGESKQLSKLAEAMIKREDITVMPLRVSGAFHSPLMEGAAEAFSKVLSTCDFKRPQTTVYSNIDGRPYFNERQIPDKLINQITKPVQWVSVIESVLQQQIDGFIEIGPGNILTGLTKRIIKKNMENEKSFFGTGNCEALNSTLSRI